MTQKRVPLGNYIREYSVRNKADADIPVYSVTNSQGFCREYFGKEVASKDKTTYKIVPYGYFAYNPSRINVGSVDWQRCEEQVIVSPLYNVFYITEGLNQQYLFYFLKSGIGRQMIRAKASGSVRDNLKLETLKEMTIPDIPVDEQERCAGILDNIQRIISIRKQQLAELDNLVKARFVEMFGDGDYPVVKLSDIATVTSGLTKNPNRPNFPIKMPYLRVANVFFNRLELNDVQKIGLQESEVEKTLLLKNDLLFVEGNGSPEQIGRVALWDGSIEPMSHQNHIIKARFISDSMIPGFAMYYFMLPIGRAQILESAVSTSGLYTLSVGKISNFTLPMPPRSEQESFMAIAAQVDKSKVVRMFRNT